ncbi:MAG: hypothetical protein AB7N70_16900 [Dehalococcoidia bacterium]
MTNYYSEMLDILARHGISTLTNVELLISGRVPSKYEQYSQSRESLTTDKYPWVTEIFDLVVRANDDILRAAVSAPSPHIYVRYPIQEADYPLNNRRFPLDFSRLFPKRLLIETGQF